MCVFAMKHFIFLFFIFFFKNAGRSDIEVCLDEGQDLAEDVINFIFRVL